MILYINSCVREISRTDKIARALLEILAKSEEITELKLDKENLQYIDNERLQQRSKLIDENDYDNSIFKYAKQFASADTIVISAPYWDFSFPALLKMYIENIYVTGIVSEYGSDGQPKGLCKAKKLYYVTTAGGKYTPNYSYDYIKALATEHFGIQEVRLIKAEMLDVDGFNSDEIVNSVIENLEKNI